MSNQQYLNSIKPGAIDGWHKYKIAPSITGAQAALESGWGSSKLAKPPYNNNFGIKASPDWTGRKITMSTQEYVNGRWITINDDFRAYDTLSDSIADHSAFFTNTEWRKNNYREVVGQIDYKKAADALQKAGYATDPGYPQKLINIIEQYNLQSWDQEALRGETTNTVTPPTIPTSTGTKKKVVGGSISSSARNGISQFTLSVIGDSLGVGTEPFLKQYSWAGQSYDNYGSRQWTHGTDIYNGITALNNMKNAGNLNNNVVFILGTNRGVDASEIDEAVSICGRDRNLILVDTTSEVNHRTKVSAEYEKAASRHDNVFYANWSSYSRANIGSWYYADGANGTRIHMNPTGYQKHADFIVQAVYEANQMVFDKSITVDPIKSSTESVNIYDIEYDDGVFTSPKGDSSIYNKALNDQLGFRARKGQVMWIERKYSGSETDSASLLEAAIGKMKEASVPAAQYTVSMRYFPDTISIGDTGIFVDHEFDPPLYIQARVLEMTTSESNPANNTVTIGNVVEVTPQAKSDLLSIQQQLQDTRDMSLAEYWKEKPVTLQVTTSNGLILKPKENEFFAQLVKKFQSEHVVKDGSVLVDMYNAKSKNATITVTGSIKDNYIDSVDEIVNNINYDEYDDVNFDDGPIDVDSNPQGPDVVDINDYNNIRSLIVDQFDVELLDINSQVIGTEKVYVYEDSTFVFKIINPMKHINKIRILSPHECTFDNISAIDESVNLTDIIDSTRVYVKAFQEEKEVTHDFKNFKWTRISQNARLDEEWNDINKWNESNGIDLDVKDVFGSESTFICRMYDDEYNFVSSIGVALSISTNGKSAYDLWIEAGNEGSEEDYLASLKGEDGSSSYTHIAYGSYNEDAKLLEFVGKTNEWIKGYYGFINRNMKSIGDELSVNSLGLVGGKFVSDDPVGSYNPPSISTSEAQVLTIRGLLRAYQSEGEVEYLDMAKWLMDAYLKYYFPTPSIPTTPDKNWVPHWMVNVNKPFRGREWFTDGRVQFTNGVARLSTPSVVQVYNVRDLDATMKYNFTPASDIIGKSYEIEKSVVDESNSSILITLKDRTVNGDKLVSYSTETGPIIEIGQKCESYPVWRLLEEGEIACAVDTVPWSLDTFKMMFEITKEVKWQQAYNSMKASIFEISNVSNTEYFIKYGEQNSDVLRNGVTRYSTRSPLEEFKNTGSMIEINYGATSENQEASFGTWVGNRRPLEDTEWIEVKISSDNEQQVSVYIDEDEVYDANKRWKSDFWVSGNGLGNMDIIKLPRDSFYKPSGIVWGANYGATSNGGVIASANSAVSFTDVIENNTKVTSIDFTRGDEGGWLGWAQYMFSIWGYKLPFEIKYKTNNSFDIVIEDSLGAKWRYSLPKTGTEYKTVLLTESMFTGGTEFASGDYASIILDSIDEVANIKVDYVGKKTIMDKKYYSTIGLSYQKQEELKIGLEYIKPAPSREPLPYVPYVLPFDFHLINYESTDLRGALYTGYQAPWIYQEGIFEDEHLALETNLQFLKDSQDAYYDKTQIEGFFAPIFWWNYRDDFGDNEPNTFGLEGNWGEIWGGFQYRTFSDVAKVLIKAPNNEMAHEISMSFVKGVDNYWVDTNNGFPTKFDRDKTPVMDQIDSHMVANYFKGLVILLKSDRLTDADRELVNSQIAKSLNFLSYWYVQESSEPTMHGTWSPNVGAKEWYNFWGGEILDALGIYGMSNLKDITFSLEYFAESNAIGIYSSNDETASKNPRDYTWSFIKGDKGDPTHFHRAWMDDENGTGFITEDDISDIKETLNKKFIGTYSSFDPTPSRDYSDYKWQRTAEDYAKEFEGVIGSEGETTYNKNRLLGPVERIVKENESTLIEHNGEGYEIGKVYTISMDVECVAADVVTWEDRSRTEVIPFVRETQYDPDLYPNQSRISRNGVDGSATYTWQVELINGILTGNKTEEVRSDYQAPINEIFIQGTKDSSDVILNFTADEIVKPTPITKSDVIINLIEPGGSLPPEPVDPIEPVEPVEPGESQFTNARVVNLADYGGSSSNTDNFNAFQQVVTDSVNEPLVLEIDSGTYDLRGADNQRLEPWPAKSKGLRIVGKGDVVIRHKNNRTNQKHEYYFMQMVMTEDSLGFEVENITLDGIRNPQEELFYTQSESNPISNVPMARGFAVNGAHNVLVNNVTFKNMYGGYGVLLEEYRTVNITNTTFDKVGGNDIQESFGMAIYLGGHTGDAVVNIDNVHAQGMTTHKDLRLSWIGVVLENGTIQSNDPSFWMRDKNTTVNITNSSFLDYHSTFHVESIAGNVYWNVDNVDARGSNYQIVAGVYGEYKEVSNNVRMDMMPYGRLWGIVKGLYYSEAQEAEDNWNGHNMMNMYNSVINLIKVAGFEDPVQAVAYGSNVTGRLHNTQLNNVPHKLVANGSALLYNSEVNLAQGSNETRQSLQNGHFSDASKQRVEFNNTNVNAYGSHKNVSFGPKPDFAKNEGFVAPFIDLPITAPI